MGLPAFDTHAYVKRLKAAGFSEQQPEAQAELQSQVLSSLVTEKLATKEDIARLEKGTKEDITRLEHATKEEISDLKNKDLTYLKMDIVRLTAKINQISWMTSFLLTGVVTILFKLFLHG